MPEQAPGEDGKKSMSDQGGTVASFGLTGNLFPGNRLLARTEKNR